MNRAMVVAHRGDSTHAPENTLPSFQAALDLGVDFVELDYLHSSDGVPMAFHDETLDRTTNACDVYRSREISIESKTAAQLQSLDAGRWFDPKFAGTYVATLEESLRLIQPRAMTMIERKAGDAKTLISLLERMGEVERVAVMAFDWEFLADCRELSSTVLLGALGVDQITEDQIGHAKSFGASIFGWLHKDISDEDPKRLAQHGMDIWTWTVDDVDRAMHLASIGVKGIISNRPGEMLSIFRDGSKPPG